MPELIEHGKDSFLVSGRQEAIESLDRIKAINRADCHRLVEDRFTADRMLEQHCEVYTMMMERAN